MKQWSTLFKKEMLGNFRDKKWLWVPLVFIILASMDPITTYYLPAILDAVGGLPEDAVFHLPEINQSEALMMSLSQLSSLGVLMIALISMGTIASERKSGVAELILVKPIPYRSYITSKWVALLVIVWVSYLLSMLVAWYYISRLYGVIPTSEFLIVTFFYGLSLTFVATLSIFYNTLVRSAGLVAFFTVGTVMVFSLVTNLFGKRWSYSPSNLSAHISEFLQTGSIPNALYASGIVSILLCTLLIIASISIFRMKEHAE